jgi:hypothetical protein
MPLQTKPEDKPAPVRFDISGKDGAFGVTCALLPLKDAAPYRIEGDLAEFANRDAFKARAVEAGMTPAVAEDENRSFNATARQLRALGFRVELTEKEREQEAKAA